ncbi:hypothetical protein BDM02DRAFT_3128343 [Thelephora ganbajun]|uniref:Uncharacterized protein n=1 Tax=Thelephora ganbajun TaxID=370292 RepID=A0ACB6ZJ14_THEGA|nr:hypothetical protein BDM02DRAFT_3128343 [Thelephora ganbajun]
MRDYEPYYQQYLFAFHFQLLSTFVALTGTTTISFTPAMLASHARNSLQTGCLDYVGRLQGYVVSLDVPSRQNRGPTGATRSPVRFREYGLSDSYPPYPNSRRFWVAYFIYPIIVSGRPFKSLHMGVREHGIVLIGGGDADRFNLWTMASLSMLELIDSGRPRAYAVPSSLRSLLIFSGRRKSDTP